MRRLVVAILLCLMLGLLTSIAVALGLSFDTEADEIRDGRVDPWLIRVERQFGVMRVTLHSDEWERQWSPDTPDVSELPAPLHSELQHQPASLNSEIRMMFAGWPKPCIFYVRRADGFKYIQEWDFSDDGVLIGGEAPNNNVFRMTPVAGSEPVFFPTKPYWPGLLFNTAVFAGVLFCIVTLVYANKVLHARIRRRRGLCPFCKYDLRGGGDRCTECGRSSHERTAFAGRYVFGGLGLVSGILAVSICILLFAFSRRNPLPPLHWAAYYGDHRAVEKLLRNGADANERITVKANYLYSIGLSPLDAAIVSGDMETFDLVIAKSDHDIRTEALVTALANGRLDLAERLLNAGADPNSGTQEGSTAFRVAASAGDIAAINLLFEHGGNPGKDATALPLAIARGHQEAVARLLELGADHEYAMPFAVRNGDYDSFLQLIECGADPLRIDETGQNLLFAIDDHGYDEQLYDYLISAGVNVNAVNSSGYSALQMATIFGNSRCVLFLLRQGADPNWFNDDPRTGLVEHLNEAPLRLALDEKYSFSPANSNLCFAYLLTFHADPRQLPDGELAGKPAWIKELFRNVEQSWIDHDN